MAGIRNRGAQDLADARGSSHGAGMGRMERMGNGLRRAGWVAAAMFAVGLTGCAEMDIANGGTADVELRGIYMIPPTTSAASGGGTLNFAFDGAVSGSVNTVGLKKATVARIVEAAPATQTLPAMTQVLTLVKTGENTWAPAPGAKLSQFYLDSLRRGLLYVNIGSERFPEGELRGVLVQRGRGS